MLGFAQGVPKLGPEQLGQSLHRHQKVLARGQPGLTVVRQCAGRNQVMHMGMIGQVTSPEPVLSLPKDMQNADHSDFPAHETRVERQFLRSCRRCPKQQVVE